MKYFLSKPIFLVLLSGLLLIPGWYGWGSGLFSIVALVPLLIFIAKQAEEEDGNASKLLRYNTLFILVWVGGDVWWIKNASFAGMLVAVFLMVIMVNLALWLTYLSWRRWGRSIGLFAFVVFWISQEFAFTHGEIGWPWLTMGYSFAYNIKLIQWYDVTGVFGGSLWILLTNVLIFLTFIGADRMPSFSKRNLYPLLAVFFLPIIISLIRFNTYHEEVNPRKIIVMQPNIDAYLKFNDIPSIEQTQIQIDLAAKLIDSTVHYAVAPETSVINNIWLSQIEGVPDIKMIRQFQRKYPNLKYITGIMCRRLYNSEAEKSETAAHFRGNMYYDTYNTAIQIDSTDTIPYYHKSILVTGVEKMPYPALFKLLKPLTLKLGGTFRSHGKQDEADVFTAPDDSVKVAPVICYESVFGYYVAEYIKKGAGLIFIITNDGWWRDTPGHRQHNAYASVRAIETRRSIARSANTGISSFVNQKGEMLQKLTWWKRDSIIEELNVNDHITFYVKHGDYIGRISGLLSIFILLSLVVARFTKPRF